MSKVELNVQVEIASPTSFPVTAATMSSPSLSKQTTSVAPSTGPTTKLSLSTLPLKTLRTPIPPSHTPVASPFQSVSKITPNIVISDARTACSSAELRKLGITHVISVLGPSLRFRPKFPDWITSLDIPLDDSPFEDLLSAVRKAATWMEEILGGCEAQRKIGGKCQCFLQDGDGVVDDQNELGAAIDEKSMSVLRPRILVHCWQGVSRSPSIVAAYFIKTHSLSSSASYQAHTRTSNMTAEKAIDFIRSKRPCVRPNQGFIRQLRQYEAIVKAECDMEDEWSTK